MSESRPRILSLSLKLAATTVLLVVVITALLSALSLRSFSEDVESQTERLVAIRTEALERVGGSTARYLALPAVGPMYDNDIAALYALVLPVVREEGASDVVYGYLVDADGRVWMAAADTDIETLTLPGAVEDGGPLYEANPDDERDPVLTESVAPGFLAELEALDATEVRSDEITREIGGESRDLLRFTAPIVDREGNRLGWLTLAYSLAGLQREVDEIRAAGESRQAELRKRMLLFGGLAAVLGAIIAILQALAITRNVKKLSRAANRIALGDLQVRADVRSRDEIGVLGAQFNLMADRVQALLVETEAKAMLERELDIARMIQEQLLPPPGAAECAGVQLAGYFKAASVCGGDFWHYDTLPSSQGDSALLTIGDVTGHGVPSAMISAVAKSGLDTLLNVSGPRAPELPWMLGELNKTVHDSGAHNLVMTFLAVTVDRRRGRMTLANAGHNFPLLVRRDGPGGAPRVRPLVVRGTRLGDEREARFEPIELDVVAGDLLLLYTDGLTEYANADGREYGDRRLRRLLVELADERPDVVLERLLGDLRTFAGAAPQEDDITLVVARI